MKHVKAGQPLIDFIRLCYVSNRAPLLIGKHGVGKSELLEKAASDLGIGFICRDLSLMEPPDLIGMPKLDGGVTRFLPPSFLPTEGKGLLVFEELNRCPSYMRAPCLQLLTARTLNDYVLPKGWLPCAAINPSDANYEVNELDPALLSRFVKALIIPDRVEWLRWADKSSIHKDVVAYVQSDAQVFKDTSPRDWCMVSDLIKGAEGLRAGPPIPRNEALEMVVAASSVQGASSALQAAIQGVVGKERAVAFATFLKSGILLPPIAEVLTDYGTYQKQIETWRNQGKTDILGNLRHELMVFLQDADNYRSTRANDTWWKSLTDFMADLPPDEARTIAVFMGQSGYIIPEYKKAEPKVMVEEGKEKLERVKAPVFAKWAKSFPKWSKEDE